MDFYGYLFWSTTRCRLEIEIYSLISKPRFITFKDILTSLSHLSPVKLFQHSLVLLVKICSSFLFCFLFISRSQLLQQLIPSFAKSKEPSAVGNLLLPRGLLARSQMFSCIVQKNSGGLGFGRLLLASFLQLCSETSLKLPTVVGAGIANSGIAILVKFRQTFSLSQFF